MSIYDNPILDRIDEEECKERVAQWLNRYQSPDVLEDKMSFLHGDWKELNKQYDEADTRFQVYIQDLRLLQVVHKKLIEPSSAVFDEPQEKARILAMPTAERSARWQKFQLKIYAKQGQGLVEDLVQRLSYWRARRQQLFEAINMAVEHMKRYPPSPAWDPDKKHLFIPASGDRPAQWRKVPLSGPGLPQEWDFEE